MKRFKGLTLLISMCFFQSSYAQLQKAGYYRVWQGFKKNDLSQTQFLNALPRFMQDTQNIYEGRALNQYLVAIPPKNKPNFIPDEFALVALHNEEGYREIRRTAEGRWYGDRHWDVFNRETSKSAPFHNFYQEEVENLEHNHAYDMFGMPVDWSSGHNLFYLGLRKPNIAKEDFLNLLKEHIESVKNTFRPFGLKGYIVISNENYEMAYSNWESQEKMFEAMQSPAGQKLFQNGSRFLEKLMFSASRPFQSGQIYENSFIKL